MATSNTLPDARCNSRRRSLLTPKISGTPSTQSNQRANRSYLSEISFVVSSVAIFLKNVFPLFLVYSFIGASNQRPNNVAVMAPAICPPINRGTLLGEIPAKVSVIARANVTAGFANDVEDVNQ